ncbi:MAG: carbohydrate ABC transporter permease [Bacteroides sp.]|nr:carbohydrate ABC transporter permease [Prevotella sp.]MCM1407494.1 carbohydrate ABC transporter permease [Treponema brennaborense]MCM1469984.1 carbohydrate ABC transporter permease [Bacteroides sp.]
MIQQKRFLAADAIVLFFLSITGLAVLVPLAFMFAASFMPAARIMSIPFKWISFPPYFMNFPRAIAGNDNSYMFLRNILNSAVVAGSVTLSTVFLSSLTGFGLAKYKFRGRNFVFMSIMATMMIPFEAIMIPLYMVALNMRIQNTYAGLILPFMISALAVFQMRQYLLSFPEEVLDAARIDGAGEPGIFFRIIFPNCGPAIATIAVLTFRQQWDSLLWPLLIAQNERMKTIPAYIVRFAAEKFTDEGAMMAVAVIASVPIFILFFTLSRYFVGGSAVYGGGKE